MTPRRVQNPATQTSRHWTTPEVVVFVALFVVVLLLATAGGSNPAP